jgi:ATP synthase F1 delta subunit
MKRSLKEIAELTNSNLSKENLGRLAKTVWIELQSNKKFASLDELIDKVRKLEAKKTKSKIVEITSTQDLDPQIKEALIEKIEQRVGGKITPIFKQDASLLGGIKVKFDDELLDISWRGKLQLIQAKLEGKL